MWRLSNCLHLCIVRPFNPKKCKPVLSLVVIILLIYWLYWLSNLCNGTVRDIIIAPSKATCRSKPYLAIIVTSYVGNVKLRKAHRRAMPKRHLDSMNVTRIFLLAKIPPHERTIGQNVIEDESRIFGDILQGSFVENYNYLPIKILMGLNWAATNFDKASYILKVDDDTAFNLEGTLKLLLSIKTNEDFFMGYMRNHTEPVRDNRSKWYVSWEDYSKDEYPPYVSGGYYITTPSTTKRVIREVVKHPYFFLEDLFITGFMTEALHIKLFQLPRGFWLHNYELLKCCIDDMIFKKIMCDAVVGLPPIDGRDNLIVEFNSAIESCQNCSKRKQEQALDKVCEAFIKVKNSLSEEFYIELYI